MMAFIPQEFVGYLDYAFPGMKKTVKMHLLEHHVSEWVDMYNAGFRLVGEQGTEAIHNHFNQLYGKPSTEAKVHYARTLPERVSQTAA